MVPKWPPKCLQKLIHDMGFFCTKKLLSLGCLAPQIITFTGLAGPEFYFIVCVLLASRWLFGGLWPHALLLERLSQKKTIAQPPKRAPSKWRFLPSADHLSILEPPSIFASEKIRQYILALSRAPEHIKKWKVAHGEILGETWSNVALEASNQQLQFPNVLKGACSGTFGAAS